MELKLNITGSEKGTNELDQTEGSMILKVLMPPKPSDSDKTETVKLERGEDVKISQWGVCINALG